MSIHVHIWYLPTVCIYVYAYKCGDIGFRALRVLDTWDFENGSCGVGLG